MVRWDKARANWLSRCELLGALVIFWTQLILDLKMKEEDKEGDVGGWPQGRYAEMCM